MKRYVNYQNDDPRVFIIGFVAVCVLVMGLVLGYIIRQMTRSNPYGEEIKIDNFSRYYNDVPQDRRDSIFAALRLAIVKNIENAEEIPKMGAMVRDGEQQYTYNKETGVHYGNFIVDIAELRQTYRVQFEWTKEKVSEALGYSVVVTCPGSYSAYEEFQCKDMLTEEKETATDLNKEFPLMKHLPIDIDYYDPDTGRYISYKISGILNYTAGKESSFVVKVSDRSGGNYELARERVAGLKCGEKKCDLADYEVQYVDLSVDVGRPKL